MLTKCVGEEFKEKYIEETARYTSTCYDLPEYNSNGTEGEDVPDFDDEEVEDEDGVYFYISLTVFLYPFLL
jgi:hypothetical protein